MEQTRLLLLHARDDANNFSTALNVLCLLVMREIPSTIEEVMYAYMVAKDWIEWIKNPNSCADADNFMRGKKTEEYQPTLEILEGYAERLEDRMVTEEDDIDEYINGFSPNLVQLWHGIHRHLNIREDARMLFRSLRYMAEFFESIEDDSFSKLLDEKEVPPMSELNKCYS